MISIFPIDSKSTKIPWNFLSVFNYVLCNVYWYYFANCAKSFNIQFSLEFSAVLSTYIWGTYHEHRKNHPTPVYLIDWRFTSSRWATERSQWGWFPYFDDGNAFEGTYVFLLLEQNWTDIKHLQKLEIHVHLHVLGKCFKMFHIFTVLHF